MLKVQWGHWLSSGQMLGVWICACHKTSDYAGCASLCESMWIKHIILVFVCSQPPGLHTQRSVKHGNELSVCVCLAGECKECAHEPALKERPAEEVTALLAAKDKAEEDILACMCPTHTLCLTLTNTHTRTHKLILSLFSHTHTHTKH